MADEPKKMYYKRQDTIRLSDQDLAFVNENYELLAGTTDRIPIGQFLMSVVDKALSQRPTVRTDPKQTERIEQLTAQLSEAQTALANLQEAYNEQQAHIRATEGQSLEIDNLNEQIANLEATISKGLNLQPGQFLIDYSQRPVDAFFILREAKARNKDVPEILIDLYNRQVLNGPGDHLKLLTDKTEVAKIAKMQIAGTLNLEW